MGKYGKYGSEFMTPGKRKRCCEKNKTRAVQLGKQNIATVQIRFRELSAREAEM